MPDTPKSGLSPRAHSAVRKTHLDERTEDYVEAIWRLEKEKQKIRIVDLQSIFGVSHVTVIRALDKLDHEGYLTRRERIIKLTAKGNTLAKRCFERHELVESFLISLGISAKTASHDAEGIEHHLSEESLRAIQKFLKNH